MRPAYGTKGKHAILWANYLAVQTAPKKNVWKYSIAVVSIKDGKPGPPTDAPKSKKLKRVVQLLFEDAFASQLHTIASDYKANMYSSVELPNVSKGNPLEVDVTYRAEGEDEPPTTGAKVYRCRVQYVTTHSLDEFGTTLSSTEAFVPLGARQDTITALDIIFQHHANTQALDPYKLMAFGGAKFYKIPPTLNPPPELRPSTLGGGLIALRGFFVSARPATGRLLLNVQVKNVAMYNPINLADLMGEFMNARPTQQAGWTREPDLRALEKFLQGLRITPTHLKQRKNKAGEVIVRVKTIFSLARSSDSKEKVARVRAPFGANPKDVDFWAKDAPQPHWLSVANHFEKTYNIRPTHNGYVFPVVNVGNRENPSWLPAHVCDVLPSQPCKTKLSGPQTEKMIRHAVRPPQDNAKSIQVDSTAQLSLGSTNPTLATFGLAVPAGLITVPGRILAAPSVQYQQGATALTKEGSWNMQKIKFSKGVTVPTAWAMVYISTRIPSVTLKKVTEDFGAEARRLGINLSTTPTRGTCAPHAVRTGQFETIIKNKGISIVLVILDLQSPDTQLYNAIKDVGDRRCGINTVCVLESKFARLRNGSTDMQYAANVALKFNLKLQGHNQRLHRDNLGFVSDGKTMLVGIDVTHPSPGSKEDAPSVAGSVASIDAFAVQFLPAIWIQERRKEQVDGLEMMMTRHLNLWKKHNRMALPENILVYRDGVSESQYHMVRTEELRSLKNACAKIYTAASKAQPRITVVVVGKRHHTRFYPTSSSPEFMHTKSGNTVNGTIVDRGVTEARIWDFFLQAHTALQGTARPAHYVVVHDEIFTGPTALKDFKLPSVTTPADALEQLTHNLCYIFGRATKAVSICPPAYYADLLCERARRYMAALFEPTDDASEASRGTNEYVEGDFGSRLPPSIYDTMFYI